MFPETFPLVDIAVLKWGSKLEEWNRVDVSHQAFAAGQQRGQRKESALQWMSRITHAKNLELAGEIRTTLVGFPNFPDFAFLPVLMEKGDHLTRPVLGNEEPFFRECFGLVSHVISLREDLDVLLDPDNFIEPVDPGLCKAGRRRGWVLELCRMDEGHIKFLKVRGLKGLQQLSR